MTNNDSGSVLDSSKDRDSLSTGQPGVKRMDPKGVTSVIAITSVSGGSGKSTVALNIASTLALAGKKLC